MAKRTGKRTAESGGGSLSGDLDLVPFERHHVGHVAHLEQSSSLPPIDRATLTRMAEHPGHVGCVAEVDGDRRRIAGHAIARLNRKRRLARLETLVVRPGWRGMGLGKELLAYLAKRMVPAGYAPLVIDVSERNEAAVAVCRSVGAVAVGVVRDCYGPGEDSWRFLLRREWIELGEGRL